MQEDKCDNGDHELPTYVGQCARPSIKFVRGCIMSSILYFSDKKGQLNIIFQPNFGSGSPTTLEFEGIFSRQSDQIAP
jgi:hypothetical protein